MRALVVSYAFPPVGGAGVQRVLKLVKYLPEHGVDPMVLTVENPSAPLRDASLLAEVPRGVPVLTARTLEPGYHAKQRAWRASTPSRVGAAARVQKGLVAVAKSLLIPDPQVLWLPGAAIGLARVLRADPPDVVFVSGPPFSQFVLALLSTRARRTAFILDYRDEWTTTSSVYEMAGRMPQRASSYLERIVVARADAITVATEAFRRELLGRFPFLDPRHVHTIENGFDPADLPDVTDPTGDRLAMTYVGTIFRLTSARGLVGAIRLLREREPALAARLDTHFVGRIVETERSYFADADALGVRLHGYVDHAEALARLVQSHLALCLLDDVPGAERVYPAKIFEIMALHRRCLALCPEGALAELVRAHRAGEVLHPRAEGAIAAWLADRLREVASGTYVARSEPLDLERFDRRRQAARFADVFATALSRATRAAA